MTREGHPAVSGEDDLGTLLRDMKPEVQDGIFVFRTLAENESVSATLRPVLMFREREGTTLVIGHRSPHLSRLVAVVRHAAAVSAAAAAQVTMRIERAAAVDQRDIGGHCSSGDADQEFGPAVHRNLARVIVRASSALALSRCRRCAGSRRSSRARHAICAA